MIPRKTIDSCSDPAQRAMWEAGQIASVNCYQQQRAVWAQLKVFLTLRCPLACAHCATHSHPNRREVMSEDLLLALLDEAARMGFERVVLFGGEPMLEPLLVRRGIDKAVSLGMEPSVVTSGFCATSPSAADEMALILDGVHHVDLSTDRSHMKFLGLDVLLRAAEACRARGIEVVVNYTAEGDEFWANDILPDELVAATRRLGLFTMITPTGEVGRAARKQRLTPELPFDAPCYELHDPLVGPLGDVYACDDGWAMPEEGSSCHYLGRYPRMSLGEIKGRFLRSPLHELLRTRGSLAALERYARDHPERMRELRESPPRSPCGACRMLSTWFGGGKEFWRVEPRSPRRFAFLGRRFASKRQSEEPADMGE